MDTTSPPSVEAAKIEIQAQIRAYEKNPGHYPTPITRAIDAEILKEELPNAKDMFDRLGKDLTTELGRLSSLRDQIAQIADNTRKPLTGIPQIVYELYRLLKSAKIGGNVWYLGMTLGFGPPHKYRSHKNGGITDELKEAHPDLPNYGDMIDEIGRLLGKLVEAAPRAKIDIRK